MLVPPGKELLCDVTAHVVRAELGAAAALSGITTRTWHTDDGVLDAAVPLAMMQPDAGPYLVSTAAIAVENTHNFGGGTVQSLQQAKALRAGRRGHGRAAAPRRRAAVERPRGHGVSRSPSGERCSTRSRCA